MLGRQQIADASTAINELFKNAHDAYADHVEVDFFGSDSLLVIRDDGVGMSREEFESKWLVLGTDSKVRSPQGTEFRPADKPERAIMGEKGIGRLAIAFLGRQVLVLTRSAREGHRGNLVMCYVHWGLFGQPSVNLEDIEIPIRCVPEGNLPANEDIVDLLNENATNVNQLQRDFPWCDLSSILSDIAGFQVDPRNFERTIEGLSLANCESGTHFYIAPADETILADIKSEQSDGTNEFSKCLLGFCNRTFGVDNPLPLETAFRFWPTDTSHEDLIGPNEFFTNEDLALSDQFVSGNIDEYGQFRGKVRVYDQEFPDHIVSWKDGGGKPTACGPFQLEFGYLQGIQRESMADPEDWTRLNEKLDRIGGLYVYRDMIRILPYGNSDIDWLDIELRRNKGMGYYFFSYRRIYGAVCLTKENNAALKEKAGREGFQKNKAYKQFKSVLENVFIQLAADFFRKEAPQGDYFHERKDELDRLERARRNREKQTTAKRARLATALEMFFAKTQDALPEFEIAELLQHIQDRMKTASENGDPDIASAELLDTEREANRELEEMRAKYSITRPRGVGLTKRLTGDWEAYQRERDRLEADVFAPFAKQVGESLVSTAEIANIHIDQRRRIQELIQNAADTQNTALRIESSALRQAAGDARRASISATNASLRELRNVIAEIELNLAHSDLSDLQPKQIEDIRSDYQQRIDAVALRNTGRLEGVREMLTGIADGINEGTDISQLDIAEALETELYALQEKADTDEELVQMGLAIAVINHEFEAVIKMIRRDLRELGTWAKANDGLQPIYRGIRTNFEHLDAHLNLFTPLQRRLYRQQIDITGKEVVYYVRALFGVRLERHRIQLDATQNFVDSIVRTYPSTIYPVFVNLLDNFIFWLKDKPGERLIQLDCTDSAYCIGNNGPPIPRRDAESIFEKGFSRKPRGRGLGLYISKRVLNKEGMTLTLDLNRSPDDGVLFYLYWNEEND